MSDAIYIDDEVALRELGEKASCLPHLAADTEFLRERTYHARLCLVQLAGDGWIACVDPLSGMDLEPLWRCFDRVELTLHAARQDLEVLVGTSGRLPGRLFDTQIAAALCGFPAQIGYASLVKELLGVDLGKHQTRTDWSRRPLTTAQLEYAADDVRYLDDMRNMLTERLEELGRLEWARADSADLLDGALYMPAPHTAWQRLRGLARMDEKSAAAAAELAVWREEEALRADRPRQWILKDAVLLELAQRRPGDRQALADIRDMPAGLVRRAGDRLLRIIRDPASAPVVRRRPPSAADKALVAELADVVRGRAEELGIEPELLASRKELRQAVAGDAVLRALSGWRDEIVGGELRELLEDQSPGESSTAASSRP
jgi:ribonuclease D